MKRGIEGTLVFFSLLLISAHFLRAGILPLSVGYIALFFLWFLKHPAGKKVIQVALLSGIAVYIYTTYLIVRERINFGLPYTKTVLIMTGVIGFIFLSFILSTLESEKN